MGRDKATLAVGGHTWAQRTGSLLAAVASPAIEVGPGRSGLGAVGDGCPGAGPLAALATGAGELRRLGWSGAALVLATDLPMITEGMLRWLAAYPSDHAVVPLANERPQPLCARYPPSALDQAGVLVAAGARSMHALLACLTVTWVGPDQWVPAAGGTAALSDVDTMEAWDQLIARREIG